MGAGFAGGGGGGEECTIVYRLRLMGVQRLI